MRVLRNLPRPCSDSSGKKEREEKKVVRRCVGDVHQQNRIPRRKTFPCFTVVVGLAKAQKRKAGTSHEGVRLTCCFLLIVCPSSLQSVVNHSTRQSSVAAARVGGRHTSASATSLITAALSGFMGIILKGCSIWIPISSRLHITKVEMTVVRRLVILLIPLPCKETGRVNSQNMSKRDVCLVYMGGMGEPLIRSHMPYTRFSSSKFASRDLWLPGLRLPFLAS